MSVNTAPYGSWKSPITADLIVANTIGLADVYLEGQNLYWQELRPAEGGRNVVMQLQADDSFQERTPTDFNVRTRVHEYGGGSFTIANSRIYGANFADQRLYQIQVGQAPKPLTPDLPLRYADGRVGIKQQIWIGVREDHRDPKTVTNTIVAIPLGREEHEGEVLVEGNDFYAAPRISPDGKYLAWLTWNHPNMPWDNTELWVAPLLPNATLGEPQRIAGGTNESIAQPVWSPDNQLYFVSDRSNWWNIYGWSPTGGKLRHVCAHKAEFTQPQWVFDASTYGFSSAAEIICTFTQQGSWYLGRINVQTGELTPIPCPYTEIGSLRVSGQRAAFIAASPTELPALITLDLQTETLRIVRRSSDLSLDPGYLAIPESISFPTADGRAAYGLYYAPQNRDVAAAPTERPPLLVKSHGGPTAAARCGLSLGIQYWTSRGIAVLDVNYGGSTGYGR
ncbi:MAG: S9 family peptidase, partial [Cyanobacteria bacterium P01_H01_bin.121]